MYTAPKRTAAQAPAHVLSLLYLVFITMTVDKSIFAIIAEPLRIRFTLSDGQLGFLTGLAYAVPFAFAGVPMGRLVDKANRKTILAAVLASWSVFTAGAALAQTYVVLLLLRGGVGAAESGGPPAMLSIIMDTFDSRQRPRAIGIYYTAAPVGAMIGALVGSRIAAQWGWRVALVAVAVPGLVLAGALRLWLREPQRGWFEAHTAGSFTISGSWRSAIDFVWKHDRCRSILVAIAVGSTFGFAVSYWITPLVMRSYSIGIAEAGVVGLFGLGLSGGFGSFTGGFIATRYLAERQDHQALLCAGGIFGAIAMVLIALFASSPRAAMFDFALFAFSNALCFGPSFSVCLSCAPLAIRGRIAALIMILSNLLGGVGPLIVGMLSDAFNAAGFKGSLRLAMAAVALLGFISVALYLRAAKR